LGHPQKKTKLELSKCEKEPTWDFGVLPLDIEELSYTLSNRAIQCPALRAWRWHRTSGAWGCAIAVMMMVDGGGTWQSIPWFSMSCFHLFQRFQYRILLGVFQFWDMLLP
jgi:hypothetical protein